MKVITILGARPQFIKAAAVSAEIASRQNITEIIVHTGQHYDRMMSDVFFQELGIPQPKYTLGVGSGTHAVQTAKMLEGIERILHNEQPDVVLVYGDTNSTIAGALAAAKDHIPLAHVEAGLRSYNRKMPEEVNRVVTDHLSTMLFCPTETAVANLMNEGIHQGVHNVGDVMLDCILRFRENAQSHTTSVLNEIGVATKKFVLATVHRAENTDDPNRLSGIMLALDKISSHLPVILPMHPRTKKYIDLFNIHVPGSLRIVPPLSYLDMVSLELNAKVICTDSGGVQKEAYFAKTPCITVRDETEWIETVQSGANHLCGADPDKILECFMDIINGNHEEVEYDYVPYGSGHASKRIVDIILEEQL